ncbi:uncharacterized protein LOC132752945 [Ruditapes philippinarum]|uniref:uncharacterized protein LOC132752945 n=1 Tax=Ruditapes philippinarum TaxID=129788 RepID=UPI00295AA472|nr:uncharacterized protein LOC132752945 [Ruditapes philippinarum]XP_060599346.1 uncharacterized protein LOC132752945 [Ruditapes philippinarum]
MLMICITAVLFVVPASAVLETNHLVQIDNDGRKVAMDVTYDSDKNTVHVVIGDVSMYEEGIQSVNLHDYNTGYGILKNINDKICLLGRAPFPKATPEKYRVGLTHEVHDHLLDINTTRLSHDEVNAVAGPNIAAFCKTYSTYYMTATPLDRNARALETPNTEPKVQNGFVKYWCVISGCIVDRIQSQQILQNK